MIVLSFLEWLIAAVCCYATLPFLMETAAGLVVGKRPVAGPVGSLDIVIVMPAHDEAGSLSVTLSRLATVLDGERVLLVADNCRDRTAAVARAAGVEVIERQDALRTGKGYALAFARDHLRLCPPDVVIVLDADCYAEPGALQRIAHLAHARRTVVQAAYLLTPQPSASPMVQISSFAFLLKNLVRQRGLHRLHLPKPLNGTGMAFPWTVFAAAPLEQKSVVEDLVLAIDLLRADVRIDFDEHSRVWSDPAGEAATLEQRQRWEGGFIGTARTYALPLIWEGLRRRRLSLVSFSAHLTTPPLALLVTVQVMALAMAGVLAIFSHVVAPAEIILLLLIGTFFFISLAWAQYGQKWLSFGALCRAPLYVLWKVPIYLRALFTRSALRWTRTERTSWAEPDDGSEAQVQTARAGRSKLLDGAATPAVLPGLLTSDGSDLVTEIIV